MSMNWLVYWALETSFWSCLHARFQSTALGCHTLLSSFWYWGIFFSIWDRSRMVVCRERKHMVRRIGRWGWIPLGTGSHQIALGREVTQAASPS